MRRIAVIGAPISIALMLEWGLFSSAALLMGVISTTALAAHQIALQVTAILFMVPLGISMAATVRVGQAFGAGDTEGVKRAGQVAMGLGIAIGLALTAAVVAFRFAIARLFLGENLPNIDATVSLAGTLLLIGGTFYIMDGLQGIAAGALRGLNDTRVPLMFAALSYWGIGFCSAYVMAFHTSLGARGVWIGLSLGTFVYATLLIWRFRLLANRQNTQGVSRSL
jgi:MATE family multidrug resistance protein